MVGGFCVKFIRMLKVTLCLAQFLVDNTCWYVKLVAYYISIALLVQCVDGCEMVIAAEATLTLVMAWFNGISV